MTDEMQSVSPSPKEPQSHLQAASPSSPTTTSAPTSTSTSSKLSIRTQHCRFCNHLLLSTTRDLATLPRRKSPGADAALILPLEKLRSFSDEDEPSTNTASSSKTLKHVTLLLSTTIPDRRATLIRREDGIEKRVLLRCGRCRVVVGYYLDRVHWPEGHGQGQRDGDGDREERREEERPPAMYVLPGALVETKKMGSEGVGEKEWRSWAGESQ
ncbi:Uncharacterized protein PECH_000157 [Penicillium ucsense]|uniref:STEEP1 domain-containing protein n=1 Tax=Penicillium ucsense TaxID=2839758 RepID=A0A8J8W5U9_9EURO|nr:Uncharacterized protein PECM_005796 [Penicillium ucsense]KAF7739635.1 Uncharacterized protein PECH_000157 [Penicillium ucsense]